MPSRIRQLTFAKVNRPPSVQPTLFEGSFQRDIVDAVSPTLHFTRYRRKWRWSRPTTADGFLLAKLGFERTGRGHAILYDEKLQDFVVEDEPSEQGNFAHFVIDLSRELLAFEEKPPDIRRQSFVGAFEALLNEGPHQFELALLPDTATFAEWLSSVDRVLRFRTVLRRPNPDWRDRTEKIRELLEPTNADHVELNVDVDRDAKEGLRIEGSILEESVTHAAGGYGKVIATGEKEGRPTRFNSSQQIKSGQIEESTEDDSASIFRKMIDILSALLL